MATHSSILAWRILWISWGAPAGKGFLLRGIFPTQGLNQGLPHCGQMLYPLSHSASPKTHFVTKGHCHPRASSAKTRGFHTQLDEGPETP